METRSMKKIYDQCFYRLHSHAYDFFVNSFAGALVKKVNKLVRAYEILVDVLIFDIVMLIITIVGTLRVARQQNRQLGVLFVWWVLVFCIAQYFMWRRMLPYDRMSQQQDSAVTAYLADTISNQYNIMTFASLQRESWLFWYVTDLRRQITFKSWRMKNWIFAFNGMTMILFNIFLRYLIIILRWKGLISVGMILVLQIYIFRLFDKMFMIGNIFKRTFQAIAEWGEMIEILDKPLGIQDVSTKILHITKWAITFDTLSFHYTEGNILFDQFSLDIKAWEKIALVGPSGSWKSTIVKLLMRFMDIDSGNIFIDGQDIAKVTQASLRASLSVVPQDPLLFHRSLKENIAYGKPDADMEEIIKASKMARCHEFISALPHGYDTLVGERGIKLSWWERQRVAIARAILEDKKILILDEATSSLDSESEKLIQDAIHELIKKKTALVIAHRLSTIKEMDRIIVLEHGKIVEQGTHEELLNITDGLYKKLRTIQAGE